MEAKGFNVGKRVQIIIVTIVVVVIIIAAIGISGIGSEDPVPVIDLFEKKYRVDEVVTFDGSDSAGEITDWTWTFSDDIVLVGEKVQRNFTEAGNYSVMLVVSTDNGKKCNCSEVIPIYGKDYFEMISGSSASYQVYSRFIGNVLSFPVEKGPGNSTTYINWTVTGNPIGNVLIEIGTSPEDFMDSEDIYSEYYLVTNERIVVSQVFEGLEDHCDWFYAGVYIQDGRVLQQIDVTVVY